MTADILKLISRIHALVRRDNRARQDAKQQAHPESISSLALSGWRFDRVRHLLVDSAGVMFPLSSAEYRLLSTLTDHPNRVPSRDRLLELTRAPGVDVNDRSIDLAVSRLRKKLGDKV